MIKSKEKIKARKKEQSRRRRKNYKPSLYIGESVELITGDLTRYPACYCSHYKGFLTFNMMKLHRCESRNCSHIHKNIEDYL